MRFAKILTLVSAWVSLTLTGASQNPSQSDLTVTAMPTHAGLDHYRSNDLSSKWHIDLPVKSFKSGAPFTVLIGLSDNSRLVFSADEKSYKIFNLKTQSIEDAFTQDKGASWVAGNGNTIVTRVGFQEKYIFRSLPDLNRAQSWSPPGGLRATKFAFAHRSKEFVWFGPGLEINRHSLDTLKPTKAPHKIDHGFDGQGVRPTAFLNAEDLGILQSSSDLKKIIVGQNLYDLGASASKRISPLIQGRMTPRSYFLAGSGDWLLSSRSCSLPFDVDPESPLLLAGNADAPGRFTFFNTKRQEALFSLSINRTLEPQWAPKVQPIHYCHRLKQMVICDQASGIFHVIDIDVGRLSKGYPIQLSKRQVQVDDIENFSYQISFSRSHFVEEYSIGDSSSFLCDPKSGRITRRKNVHSREFTGSILKFYAKLKGGSSISGTVEIQPGE